MANRTTRPTRTTNQSNRRVNRSQSKSNKGLFVGLLAVLLLVVVGIVVYLVTRPQKELFTRATLDKYVELTATDRCLNEGATVYIDMSDGMLYAYMDDARKRVLESVINKLAADDAVEFCSLSHGKIEPLDGKSHTELYNYVLDDANYEKRWSAPIEETLRTIVEKQQPALLMTDFEEYNNGQIQRAAYAKRYFIDWLKMGNNITFYRWDFDEKGVKKSMFLAVFDDNYGRLKSLVSTAVQSYGLDSFVLAGKDFTFPTYVSYNIKNEGGGYRYHGSVKEQEGLDIITNLIADGGSEAYCCYASPQSTPSGHGSYSDLTQLVGIMAEYYPFGITWAGALENIKNAKATKDFGYTHLLSGLSVNFSAQDGYMISSVELRVFDMSQILTAVKDTKSITCEDIFELEDSLDLEVFDMLKVSMGDYIETKVGRCVPLYVDVNPNFNGSFNGGIEPSDVFRANIVISDVEVNNVQVERFFGWERNNSLSNSVMEALEAQSSNPTGKIIYTYYLKTIEEK